MQAQKHIKERGTSERQPDGWRGFGLMGIGLMVAIAAMLFAGTFFWAGFALAQGEEADLTVSESDTYGVYLADTDGQPLYVFSADIEEESRCYDQCAENWPPAIIDAQAGDDEFDLTVGEGVDISLMSAFVREDGEVQLTYNSAHLYYFVQDEDADEPQGHGVTAFGGEWYLVSPVGGVVAVEAEAAGAIQATPTATPSEEVTGTMGMTETVEMTDTTDMTGTEMMSPTMMGMLVEDAALTSEMITATGDVSATAQIINTDGDPVGMALFTPVQIGENNIDAILVQVQFQGFTAADPGVHALHIHETGACEPPDFTSAGGHYNPLDSAHGFLHPDGLHVGDLPNIELDENGNAHYQWATARITLNEGERAILDDDGSAIVLHATADNYITQPSGGGGDMIACGVIEAMGMTSTMGMTGTTDSGEANTVQVSLIEWAIEMPNELPAGPTTFVVTNDGTGEHNFAIENEEMGFEEVFAEDFQTGDTMTMTVDLQPGEYYVYCPIGNHAERGMELTLTVTEAGTATTAESGTSASESASGSAGEAAASQEDMAMAEALWQQMQEANYREAWATIPGKGTFYAGQPPHGALLSTFFNPPAADAMEAQPGMMPMDAIVVKENYDADRNLLSVTVMAKEPDYDPTHNDWYWARYGSDGEVQAAGMAPGCIACHGAVSSNDYIFSVPIAPIEP